MNERIEKHFEAGPSKLDRVIACPGSVVASRGIDEGPMLAAEHGKRLHTLLETCLKNRTTPADYPTDGDWAVYSDDDREAVAEVVRHVQELLDEFPGELLVEVDVDLSDYFPGLIGRVDVAIVSGKTLIVIDGKFGRVPVSAETAQLKAYALGLLDAYSYLSFEQVIGIISQPFAHHYDETRYAPDELELWAQGIMVPALKEAFGPAPRFNPAPEACRYCRARAVCAVRKTAHYDAIAAALDDAPEVALLSNAEIAEMLPRFDNFEAYVNDVREYATRELLAGRPITGYKIVEGRSIRKWLSSEAAIAGLLEALRSKRPELPPADAATLITATSPITITAAEKLLGRGNPCFASLTVKPQGRPTLAPESDARPPYAPSGAVSEALDAVDL
jgi:hypothetical protein